MRTSAGNVRQAALTLRHLANIGRPRQPLFLMSHTRSYSSLLCHILNSNPEIDGYGELWIDYRSVLDMLALRYKIANTTGERLSGRYTLDKLLHNKLDLCDEILLQPSTRVMIGIREPEGAVRSNLIAGRAPNSPPWKRTPEAATTHYVRRIEALVKLAERRADLLFFPMDGIVDQTDQFLAGLSAWLELDEPLAPRYEVGKSTGTPAFGDTSEHIRSGSVRRDRPNHDVDIPDDQLERLWTAYERSMSELAERCQHVVCIDALVARPT